MFTRISAPARPLVPALAALAAIAGAARADLVPVETLADVVLWAGTGPNEAGFVLQFSAAENPASVAWGYRWSGTATMQDMVFAIAGMTTVANGQSPPPGLDDRLAVAGSYFSFGEGSGGVFIDSITYAQAGLPAGWTPTTRRIRNEYFINGTYPALYTRADAGGAWTGVGPSQAMDFAASDAGISDLPLAAGGWYGLVQSSAADPFAFVQPVAAVPEPSGWALLVAAAGAALAAGRAARARRAALRSFDESMRGTATLQSRPSCGSVAARAPAHR